MRRVGIALVLAAFLTSACDSGEVERLRAELDEAHAEVAKARRIAQRSERNRRSIARQLDQMRGQLAESEGPGEGVVLSIPLVGRLTWECNDGREFSFTFIPSTASVTVEQSVDGEVTRKLLGPGEELSTGFMPPDAHREWSISYRHKPAIISAGIAVVPDVRGGACFISNSTLELNRRPN